MWLKAFTVVIALCESFWVITRRHSMAGNQHFGTDICHFFTRLLNHPEEGTDIRPETLVSCQRMTPSNNPEAFIKHETGFLIKGKNYKPRNYKQCVDRRKDKCCQIWKVRVVTWLARQSIKNTSHCDTGAGEDGVTPLWAIMLVLHDAWLALRQPSALLFYNIATHFQCLLVCSDVLGQRCAVQMSSNLSSLEKLAAVRNNLS